ncbi:MAG: CBS domain-containing protein [Desulfitobacterium sp.]|nr:CBS domain-containing protein [Desulfitobacterium sp.]
MRVRDIMTQDLKIAQLNSNLVQVAKMMEEEDVGAIPVVEAQKLKGIVTDRDIIIRAIAQEKDPQKVQAGEIMTDSPITITPDGDAHEAARIMSEKQIRRIPVVEQGNLVGMLSLGDLAVVNIHVDEAGEALSGISQGIQH